MPWSSSGLSNRTGLTATASSATLSVPNRGWAWTGSANSVATAWAAAVVTQGGTVSAGRQTLVTQCISSLMAAGVWTSLDCLWLLAGENTQSALVDVVAQRVALPVNAPTFTVDRGYTGNFAGQARINTTFNASTAPGAKFTQNNAGMGVWVVAPCVTASGYGIGNNDSTYSVVFIGRNTADQRRLNITASAPGTLYAVSAVTGHMHHERSGAAAQAAYFNGVQESTNTTASAGLINQPHQLFANISSGGVLNGYADAQISAAWIGASLGSAGALAFYNAMRTYMTAVGVP